MSLAPASLSDLRFFALAVGLQLSTCRPPTITQHMDYIQVSGVGCRFLHLSTLSCCARRLLPESWLDSVGFGMAHKLVAWFSHLSASRLYRHPEAEQKHMEHSFCRAAMRLDVVRKLPCLATAPREGTCSARTPKSISAQRRHDLPDGAAAGT